MKYITPDWPAPTHIKSYCTTKLGWGNKPQSPAQDAQLKSLLHLPHDPIWLNQTHSTITLEAQPSNLNQEADAAFSAEPNKVCSVLTADCLPVLICDQAGKEVAAVHAGWRGLAAGVIEATLDKLQAPAEELLVWLGPAIGPNKFEVGKDVYEAFTSKHPQSASAFKPHAEDKWLANLYELAKIRLLQKDITQIYGGEYCTYTQEDLFFSYRREGRTGRMASLIWISK